MIAVKSGDKTGIGFSFMQERRISCEIPRLDLLLLTIHD